MGENVFDINVLNDHTRPWDPFKNLFEIYKYRTSGRKSSCDCHLVKKIKRPRTSMACGDADEQIQWINTDISIVVISVKKYRKLLVSVVLLLITSHCKAKKAPICHSETLNSLWTGNVTKNFISDSTNDIITVPKNTKLYSFISVVNCA